MLQFRDKELILGGLEKGTLPALKKVVSKTTEGKE